MRIAFQTTAGVVAIALVTWGCFQTHLGLASPLCLDLIVIVLLSLRGSFLSAAIVSVAAVALLDFYFTEPLFSLQVLAPIDAVVIALFLINAAVITTLVSRLQMNGARLAATNAQLEEQMREVKQAQDQLHLARFNRVMLMGEMTASIAHEVNQPLTGIVANAGTGLRYLAAETPNVEEARHCLSLIARDGRRAGDVVSRIRDLVKKTPPNAVFVDVNETIREVLALTDHETRADAVVVHTQLAADLPGVIGDRVQLQQVIMNLVVNAFEALSGAGGHAREVIVASRAGDAQTVVVEVRDSGAGLDPETIERLFTSFYTTKEEGMGMGLSISRSIVEAHGGRLWAQPNLPHGAAFSFSLPAAERPRV